jgi:hypothetical protein
MERIQQGLAGTGAPDMKSVESTVVTPADPATLHLPIYNTPQIVGGGVYSGGLGRKETGTTFFLPGSFLYL